MEPIIQQEQKPDFVQPTSRQLSDSWKLCLHAKVIYKRQYWGQENNFENASWTKDFLRQLRDQVMVSKN